jgi:hypothetical protein
MHLVAQDLTLNYSEYIRRGLTTPQHLLNIAYNGAKKSTGNR